MDTRTPQLTKSSRKSIGQRLQEQYENAGTPKLKTATTMKTPMTTRNRHKSMVIQSEKKSIGRKSKRRQFSVCDDVFTVETLIKPESLQKNLGLDDDRKVFKKCVVNLEPLTPNKLNLVKTVTSPLVKIRNALQASKVVEIKPVETDEFIAGKSDVDINQNNPEQTLNRTFSYSDDETNKNDTTYTKEDDLFATSPPGIFNAINVPNIDDSKRSSISKRLSKSLKPLKSKLSKSSGINKSSRLSTISSSRKPKLSGSQAVQLFEFLTEAPFKSNEGENDKIQSPPSSSSTPKPLKNHVIRSVLKSTLKRHSVTFADHPSVNGNDEQNSSKVSRGKMPNFALIHKKRFDKMENISEYKQRKSERAKLLLSGAKPLAKSLSISTPKNKGIKKELVNSFNRIDTKFNETAPNTEDFAPLVNTPMSEAKSKVVVAVKPVLRFNTEENTNISHPNVTLRQKSVRINVSPTFDSDKSSFPMRKTPFKENVQREVSPHVKKSIAKLNFVQNDEKANIKDLKSNITDLKESSKPFKNVNTVKEAAKPKNIHTRFGFKAPIKNKKEDIVKAVVNKSRIVTGNDTMDEKRAIIKGVRSNRRFDLLMKMRLNK